MNRKSVSCIISLFRCEKYLTKFLENVVSQENFEQNEYILFHVCPNLKEKKIILKYKKKYPKNFIYLISKKKVSLPKAWNECIKNSSKKFIAIWNVDDLRTHNSLSLQLSKFRKNIDFVYGNFTIVNKFGSKNGQLVKHHRLSKDELNKSMILGPFFMFRKEIIRKIGFFDEQLKSSSDFDFALRLASFSKGFCVKENLGFYLNEGKGLSTKINTLQGSENNVIYLRYSIFEKVDFTEILNLNKYSINLIIYDLKYHQIETYFKNYKKVMKLRKKNFEESINYKKNIKRISRYIYSKFK